MFIFIYLIRYQTNNQPWLACLVQFKSWHQNQVQLIDVDVFFGFSGLPVIKIAIPFIRVNIWFHHHCSLGRCFIYLTQMCYILTKSISTLGSVNGANCKELAAQPDVDGFLVGGASLKVFISL